MSRYDLTDFEWRVIKPLPRRQKGAQIIVSVDHAAGSRPRWTKADAYAPKVAAH